MYEATYLLCQGYRLAGKEKVGKRTAVLFMATNGLQQATLDYYAGAVVEARQFADRYRALKDYIFSNLTEHEPEEIKNGISNPKQ